MPNDLRPEDRFQAMVVQMQFGQSVFLQIRQGPEEDLHMKLSASSTEVDAPVSRQELIRFAQKILDRFS